MKADVKVMKTDSDFSKIIEVVVEGLPSTFNELVDSTELSLNGKLRPICEVEVSFNHVTDDGYMVVIGGKLPLWLDKLTTKRVIDAKEKQALHEKRKAKETELEVALSKMTETELRELLKKSLLK